MNDKGRAPWCIRLSADGQKVVGRKQQNGRVLARERLQFVGKPVPRTKYVVSSCHVIPSSSLKRGCVSSLDYSRLD